MRQRHLELDLGQLLRRLADLSQKRQPARVGVDLFEQVLSHDLAEARVAVIDRLAEPRESLIGLAPESVDVGDVVWRVLSGLTHESHSAIIKMRLDYAFACRAQLNKGYERAWAAPKA